jgi:hypothetical protein
MLRKIGTCLITIEQYGPINEFEVAPELSAPLFLADSLFHLVYAQNTPPQRWLRVVKMRDTLHAGDQFQFFFIRGLGIVIPTKNKLNKNSSPRDEFTKVLSLIKRSKNRCLLKRITLLQKYWKLKYSPKPMIDELLHYYGVNQQNR